MSGLARLDGAGRMPGVDLARGLAVIGMFAAHLVTVEAWEFGDPATWADIANGRSSILFATLAGVSIGIVTGGTRALVGRPLGTAALRLVVRAALLWTLGLLLIRTGVPIAIILPAYAVLFLLALPFVRMSAPVLFAAAAVLGVFTPLFVAPLETAFPELRAGSETWTLLGWEYPFVVWIAFVLAGLGLARADLGRLRTQVGALVAGALASAAGYGLGVALPADPGTYWAELWTSEPHSSGILEVLGSGGFAIAVIGLSCLACRTVIAAIALPLRAVGSMPLTAYTVQVLVWWAVGVLILEEVRDLSGARELGLFWYLAIGVTVACTGWAILVGRGPLEWATDRIVRAVIPTPRPARGRVDA